MKTTRQNKRNAQKSVCELVVKTKEMDKRVCEGAQQDNHEERTVCCVVSIGVAQLMVYPVKSQPPT